MTLGECVHALHVQDLGFLPSTIKTHGKLMWFMVVRACLHTGQNMTIKGDGVTLYLTGKSTTMYKWEDFTTQRMWETMLTVLFTSEYNQIPDNLDFTLQACLCFQSAYINIIIRTNHGITFDKLPVTDAFPLLETWRKITWKTQD